MNTAGPFSYDLTKNWDFDDYAAMGQQLNNLSSGLWNNRQIFDPWEGF
jgi:hypothetical protein